MTLTAPGADELPWDTRSCPPDPHRCSGRLGCRVEVGAAATWNSTVTKRLGDLLKVAREQVRRAHGSKVKVRVLAYVCEAQQRGVFHPHVVLGYATAAERAALDTFVDAVERKRGHYGFGTGRSGSFDRGRPGRFDGTDAGRYVSKYLRPDGAKKSFVPLLFEVAKVVPRDPVTNRAKVLVRPVYVSTALTKRTRVTMVSLRFKRWIFVALGPGCPEHEARELFASHKRLCEMERMKRESELLELRALYREFVAEVRCDS